MDTAYRQFTNRLQALLDEQDKVIDHEQDLLDRQKGQLQNLFALEKNFCDALADEVYAKFIHYITKERHNILSARPYYRERSVVFSANLAQAFKTCDVQTIRKFRLNWTFIDWVQKQYILTPEMKALVDAIARQRSDLVEQNLLLPLSQARIFWNKTPHNHLEYLDIVQICAQGFLLAVDKFVPPIDEDFTPEEARHRWKSFRAVAIGIILRDRVNAYCLDEDVTLVTCDGQHKKIKDFIPGDKILGVDAWGETIHTQVVALHDHGVLNGYEVIFENGYKVVCSKDHKFLTANGMVSLDHIGSMGVYCEPSIEGRWMETSMWESPSDTEGWNNSRQNMSRMSSTDDSSTFSEGNSLCSSSPRRVEDTVPFHIPHSGSTGSTPQDLSCMNTQIEASLASMAHSHAPLASTGGLVLRKIIRISPVGPKHMYDIEVSHPKHNFLLPSGIVTSNSETALHFYPADRAKIYRANKILRVAPPEVDYTSLAEQINKHIDNPAIVTNAAEIRELLAASSTVSADYHLEPDGESIVESYTDESDRPDISIEHTDALKTMYRAIETLSLREQKLLKMRGISK